MHLYMSVVYLHKTYVVHTCTSMGFVPFVTVRDAIAMSTQRDSVFVLFCADKKVAYMITCTQYSKGLLDTNLCTKICYLTLEHSIEPATKLVLLYTHLYE